MLVFGHTPSIPIIIVDAITDAATRLIHSATTTHSIPMRLVFQINWGRLVRHDVDHVNVV